MSVRVRALVRDTRAATLVEFGIVLLPMCVFLLGATELGYRAYTGAVLQGTLLQAARIATVGGVGDAEVDSFVRGRLKPLTQTPPVITRTSYYEYSRIGKPEKIIIDKPPIGSYNTGDCWEDANGNGKYDTQGGRAGGGSSEEVVYYSVSLPLARITPMDSLLGWSKVETITQTTVLRNQPYGKRATYAC